MNHIPTASRWSIRFSGLAISGLLVVLCPNSSHAGMVIVNYSGHLTSAITVGGSTIPNGSLFAGQLSYDFPQSGVITSFFGGTQSVFSFSSLTWTINGQTVTESSGQLGLYNDVNPPTGVPVGDSLYTFVPGIPNNAPGPSSGSIDGVTPNYIYLGFADSSGMAFASSALPQSLSLAEFSQAFLGVNYGPLGSGNIDKIFFLSSLTSSVVPEPGSATLLAVGMCVLPAMALLRKKRRTR